MSIDTSKPFFPQDYPLEEVLATLKRMPMATDEEHAQRLHQAEREYYIRKGGVAGIFNDLRLSIIRLLGQPDDEGFANVKLDDFKDMVTHDIAEAIFNLEGNSILTTKFIIQEYAVPAFKRDESPEYNCAPVLIEETRSTSKSGMSIASQYWELVNS